MDKEEIEAKLAEIAQQLAELSGEVCKESDAAAALVELQIINVMGKCQIQMNVQTSGKKKDMERVGKIIDRVITEMEKEEAAENPTEPVAKEPVDVDGLLKDILSKRKMKE